MLLFRRPKLVVVGAGGISGPPPIHSTKKGDFLFHIPEQSHSTEEEPLHFSRRRRRKQVRRLSFGGGGGNLSPRIISPRPPSPLPLSLRPDLLPFFSRKICVVEWTSKRVSAEVCRRWYGVNNICPGVNTTGWHYTVGDSPMAKQSKGEFITASLAWLNPVLCGSCTCPPSSSKSRLLKNKTARHLGVFPPPRS